PDRWEGTRGPHPGSNALGLGFFGQPPHARRGESRSRLRLPGRDRGAGWSSLRAETRSAWGVDDGVCRVLRTAWIPEAEVEKTTTVDVPGVELSMEALGAVADGAAATAALSPLVAQYRAWIEEQRRAIASLRGKRRETADELLRLASVAA